MAEKKTTLSQLKEFLGKTSLSQRIFLVASIIASVIGVYIIINLANTFRYGVLFSNLSVRDSGQIIEKLKEQNISYKIAGGGSVIQVPEDKISELRIELASGGLPEGGGVGFEIFDDSSIATTDFVQNINYIRALEGELSRSIAQLREIISARVHITMAKQSVFIEEIEPAKASIVLKLKPGGLLSKNIIPAIIHLTSQAVEGLSPENIAIVDINGTLLSKPITGSESDSFDENSTRQLAYQRKLENEFSQKIIRLLDPVVGSGKVKANVKLQLDFKKIETKQETVDPEKVAKISELTETNSSTGATPGGGVPGVGSNVAQAGTAAQATSGKPSKSKSEKTTTNYEISKMTTIQINPVGEIRKVSCAVVIDNALEVNLVDGVLEKSLKPRTVEELEKIKKIVQAAIGYNEQRGDTIEVANLPFDTALETEGDYYFKKEKTSNLINTLIKHGLTIISALILFFFIIRPIARKAVKIYQSISTPESESIELPKEEEKIKSAALQSAEEEAEIEKELNAQFKRTKETKKNEIVREKIIDFTRENLDSAATIVRTFLMEE